MLGRVRSEIQRSPAVEGWQRCGADLHLGRHLTAQPQPQPHYPARLHPENRQVGKQAGIHGSPRTQQASALLSPPRLPVPWVRTCLGALAWLLLRGRGGASAPRGLLGTTEATVSRVLLPATSVPRPLCPVLLLSTLLLRKGKVRAGEGVAQSHTACRGQAILTLPEMPSWWHCGHGGDLCLQGPHHATAPRPPRSASSA